jgi:hypothetical protein
MCDERVKMDAAATGKQAPCPLCKRIIKVPHLVSPKKQDWRSAAARPTGAKVDQPELEGAWGSTTNRSVVSGEALEEADAIPVKRERLTVRQWVARGMFAAAILLLLGGGTMALLGWLGGKKQKNLLDKAMASVSGKDPALKGPRAGIVHLAAGNYHIQRQERDCVVDDKVGGGARGQLRLAKEKFVSPEGATAERDALLIAVALVQLDMGGIGKAVEERARLGWPDTIKEVVRTVQGIRQPEGKAQPEARVEAVRQLSRKLIELGKDQYVEELAQQIGDGPVSLAAAGVELYHAGKEEAATRLCKQVLTFFKREATPAKPPAGQKKQEPPLPPLTLDIMILAELLGPEKRLPPATEPRQKKIEQMGKAVAAGVKGSIEEAQQKIQKLSTPALQMEALVAIADLTIDDSKAKPLLEQALQLFREKLGNQPLSPWTLARLVRVGLGFGVDPKELQVVAQRIPSETKLEGWVQFLIFRHYLAHESGKVDDSEANKVDPESLSHGLARVELARHNARKDKGTIAEIDNWSESLQPYGWIGAALGLQGEK